MPITITRRPRRLAAFAAVAAITTLGAASTTAVSSAATPTSVPSSEFLFVPPTPITTSTGHKLTIGISGLATSIGGSVDITSVQVTLNRSNVETHLWNFQLSGTPLTANAKTGTATLTTGTGLGTFGSLTLKATSSGAAKTTNCDGSKTIDHPVTIKGIIDFKSESTGKNAWGNVGGATKHFTIKHGDINGTTGDGDGDGASCLSNPCPDTGIDVTSGLDTDNPDATLLIGIADGHSTLITVSRNVTINTTTSRQDSVLAKAKATAKHSGSGESLTLKPTQTSISGSAELKQTSKPRTTTCKKTTTSTYSKASLTSKHLVGHAEVFGSLTVASSAKGNEFDITKKK